MPASWSSTAEGAGARCDRRWPRTIDDAGLPAFHCSGPWRLSLAVSLAGGEGMLLGMGKPDVCGSGITSDHWLNDGGCVFSCLILNVSVRSSGNPKAVPLWIPKPAAWLAGKRKDAARILSPYIINIL